MDRLERWTIPFTRMVAFLGLVALLALAAVILANAALSWLFTAPIDGVRDWVKLIVAIAIAACLPSVLATRANITIRFLGRIVGPRGERILELFGSVVTLAALAILAWQLQDYVIELRETGETTENLGMPIAPWWQVVTVLFYLGVAIQALVVISSARDVLRGRAATPHAAAAPPPASDS
jgi:TRAP-type C4-dicarboxylate transport system permease small subunit